MYIIVLLEIDQAREGVKTFNRLNRLEMKQFLYKTYHFDVFGFIKFILQGSFTSISSWNYLMGQN